MNKIAPGSKTQVKRQDAKMEISMTSANTTYAVEAAEKPAPARSIADKVGSWLRQLVGKAGDLLERALPTILLSILLLGMWQIACSGKGASLPPPSKVLTDTWPLIIHPFAVGSGTDQGLGWQIFASLKRVSLGFGLAAVVGISFGVLLGQSRMAYRALDPLVQVLRMVPPLAWLPLSLAIFQKAQPSAIFVIFITALWPIVLNTVTGVASIPQNYRNIARVLQLTGPEYFVKILLPAAVPHIFTGLRIGVGMSWIAIIASETLVGGVGIGFFIWDAWNSSLLSEIIIALVYVGLVGFVLDRMISALGRIISRAA